MTESTPTLSFHDGEPPQRSDRQYIALAIPYDSHDQEPPPRWCVIQWGDRWGCGPQPYWEWSVPGYSTSVRVLKWAQLPELDFFGKLHAEKEPRNAA